MTAPAFVFDGLGHCIGIVVQFGQDDIESYALPGLGACAVLAQVRSAAWWVASKAAAAWWVLLYGDAAGIKAINTSEWLWDPSAAVSVESDRLVRIEDGSCASVSRRGSHALGDILLQRERIKRQTIALRGLQHQRRAA
jgi:hypothetical protein